VFDEHTAIGLDWRSLSEVDWIWPPGLPGREDQKPQYAENGDRLLTQTCWLTTATVQWTSPREDVFATAVDDCCLQYNTTRYCTPDTMVEIEA